MSESGELSLSAVRHKRAQNRAALTPEPPRRQPRGFCRAAPASSPPPQPQAAPTPKRFRLPVDPWRLLMALKHRGHWMIWTVGLAAALGLFLGYVFSSSNARVTLISQDAAAPFAAGPEGGDYQPRELAAQTLVNLMGSPELLRRVAAKAQPAVSEASLKRRVHVAPVPNTELVALNISGRHREALATLANLYAAEAVQLSKELQTADSTRLNQFCREKLAALDHELQQAGAELVKFQSGARLIDPDAEKQAYVRQLGEILSRADNARIEAELVALQVVALRQELAQQHPVAQKLQAARNRLTDLRGRMTEAHPSVQSQLLEIAELEKQMAGSDTNALSAAKFSENPVASTLYLRLMELQTRQVTLHRELQELKQLQDSVQDRVAGVSAQGLRYANLKAQIEGLQRSRTLLATRQREAQLHVDNAQGYYRVFAAATPDAIDTMGRWHAGILAALAGLVIGVLGAGLAIIGLEVADCRLKTAADVERVTRLPVLARLGDLNTMSAAEKDAWAFRTWTAISGQLNSSPNQGMVCGFVSSTHGEGRSTWIQLLVDAANQRGLRVLTVTAHSSASDAPPQSEVTMGQRVADSASPVATEQGELQLQMHTKPAHTSVLPTTAARHVADSESPLTAHIALPGWAGNLEHRKQWQNALAQWRAVDNLVLFVELPPASVPEAVMLAESLPQIIWLADSGKPHSRLTRQQLETLRHAQCRLVGAVLNHEPKPVFEL
ncbi:MAG: hypothetical protein KIS67_16535 [Verrucomicrobiae bacterium]|nr:hypothetical protein [Verrucomicrobiae bacterium]